MLSYPAAALETSWSCFPNQGVRKHAICEGLRPSRGLSLNLKLGILLKYFLYVFLHDCFYSDLDYRFVVYD